MILSIPRCFALFAFAGLAQAAVPGVYAIQEKRILAPNSAANDNFGGSEPRWVGDMDGDGIQDMVIGLPKANRDSGALVFQTMSYQGGVKQTWTVNARDPLIASTFQQTSNKGQFGTAVAVVLPFSSSRSCAILATFGSQYPRLLTLKVCRDQGSLRVASVQTTDTSSTGALHGLGIGTSSFTGSLQMVDTLPGGARLLALGMSSVGTSSTSHIGRVALLQVDTMTSIVAPLNSSPKAFPNSWAIGDPVGKDVPDEARFGQSVVRLGKDGGQLQLGVLAPGSKTGSKTGRLHILRLDAAYNLSTASWTALGVGADTITSAYSLSVADFDHDGNPDLLVGAPISISAQSSFWVATMDASRAVRGLQQFLPGTNGFVDTAATLANGSLFGSSVLAGDLNQDGMVDAFVGAQGNTTLAGSLWSIRLKSAPWIKRAPDTLFLAFPSSAYKMLGNYVGGKTQGWSARALDPKVPDSTADCRVIGGGDTALFTCYPGNTNGVSHWRVTVYDTGNSPASVRVYDSIDLVVKTSGISTPTSVGISGASSDLKVLGRSGILFVRAGPDPFVAEVFGTDGRRLGEMAGGAFASRSLDLRGGPATVVVRAKDGNKIRQDVVFLGR